MIKTETHHSRLTCCHDCATGEYWLGSPDFGADERAMAALMPMGCFLREFVNGYAESPLAAKCRAVAADCIGGRAPSAVPSSPEEKATLRAVWDYAKGMKDVASFVGGIAFHVTCPVAGEVDLLRLDKSGPDAPVTLHVCGWCEDGGDEDALALRLSALRLLLELSQQFDRPFGECYALVASHDHPVRRKDLPDRRFDAAVDMFKVAGSAWFRRNESKKPI